jgi:hypothetical protein
MAGGAECREFEGNTLALEIVNILAPRVGAIVARAMVQKQCKLLGISPRSLARDQIELLADKIEHILVIFGHDSTGLGEKIRALGS